MLELHAAEVRVLALGEHDVEVVASHALGLEPGSFLAHLHEALAVQHGVLVVRGHGGLPGRAVVLEDEQQRGLHGHVVGGRVHFLTAALAAACSWSSCSSGGGAGAGDGGGHGHSLTHSLTHSLSLSLSLVE